LESTALQNFKEVKKIVSAKKPLNKTKAPAVKAKEKKPLKK
jgi:hypothetical protein